MLTQIYTKLCRISPGFRKSSRRLMYQLMARHYQKDDWSFMNYGYALLEPEADMLHLHEADEPNRYCIQLYHHVAGAVDLTDRHVLEVGSGRGGGSHYIKRYLGPKTVVGVDFSEKAVRLCNRHYSVEGLAFLPGDAESLPFDDESFDAVVNVESSHCYSSMDAFLAQVRRVLRQGGHFLFADFRHKDQLETLDAQLRRSGMAPIRQTDITSNVLEALDADHGRRIAHIRRGAPKFLSGLIRQFAGVQGSQIYERFRKRETVYLSFVMRKV